MSLTPSKAVIPCAGFGTRFLPITKAVPKEFLPIGDKPAIHYVVEEVVAAGVREVILVCNRFKTSIADYFRPDPALVNFLKKKGKVKELESLEKIEAMTTVRVVYQEEARGLGDAIGCAQNLVRNEPFLVLLPDELVFPAEDASARLISACRQHDTWGIIVDRVPQAKTSAYGIVKAKEMGKGLFRIDGAVEKPKPSEAPSDLSIAGRYLFPPDIFPLIAQAKAGTLGEIQITDAIDRLARKTPGIGILCQGRRLDVGTPAGLLEAADHFHRRA